MCVYFCIQYFESKICLEKTDISRPYETIIISMLVPLLCICCAISTHKERERVGEREGEGG